MLKLSTENRLALNYFTRYLGKALLFASIGGVSIYGLGYVVRYFGAEEGTEVIIAMLALSAWFILSMVWSRSKIDAADELARESKREEKIINRLQDWKE